MAALGGTALTLIDWAKRVDKDGKVDKIVEILSQTNEILDDMLFKEGNLPVGDMATIRTGLPDVYYRLINQAIPTSKSTTAQITENCAMLEAYSEVDEELCLLNGNVNETRLSEAAAFLQAMNNQQAETLFYGSAVNSEEYVGLANRYTLSTDTNGQNIIKAGGAGSDNTSIYLVGWSPQTVYGIFPKGSKAGIRHDNIGLVTVQGTTGIGGTRMRAYQDHWIWKSGLMIKDWRYVVRIANIDVSALVADGAGSSVKLMELMLKAIHRLPTLNGIKPAFYCNRTVREMLDIQAQNKANILLNAGMEEGKMKTTFRGIPIRTVDALLETEATIS